MEIAYCIFSGLLINAIIGAGVCAVLDPDDQVFYNWFKKDPSYGLFSFIILECWPIMAVFMCYRRRQK